MLLIIKQIKQEPVMFQGLLQALLALLAGFGIIKIDQSQMGLIFAFTASLLAFLTRQAVTPLVNPKNKQGKPLTPNN
jgi:uncharacterized membrane protein YjjP (DUF1212 family)